MSRPSSSRQTDIRSPLNTTPSRRPSPATLAAANAEQAATAVTREASFKDGVLTILSYDTENVFIFSNLSYEHVLESALANFSTLKSSRVERSQIRLAVQTKIGNVDTLVQVTPDTWPAVATRAQVVTVLVQQPLSDSPSQRGPGFHPKLPPPPVPYRLVSPPRDSEHTNWSTSSPPHHSTWPPHPPTAYTTSSVSTASPAKSGSLRVQVHSRQGSQGGTNEASRAQYPYAQAHYIPSGSNAVSPTTDVSFLGVRPIADTDLRRDRPDSYHTELPSKRRWDQLDDSGMDERVYVGPDTIAPPGSSNRQQFGSQVQQHEDARKPKRTRAWNPPDHQYMCRRCHRTDSPAWRKGPDGPKTLCNACGLSYAKDAARREAAASTSAPSTSAQAPSAQVASERPAPYTYNSDSTNSNHSRTGRGSGVKTLDGSGATLSTIEGTFPGPTTAPDAPRSSMQPLRKCAMCKRTDSPQWRKGLDGPNTLCNSCGLQWARTQRKSEGTHSRAASSRSSSPAAAMKTVNHVVTPVSTTIGAEPSLTGSVTGRGPQLQARNDRDDERRRSPSAVSQRSDSPEDTEA